MTRRHLSDLPDLLLLVALGIASAATDGQVLAVAAFAVAAAVVIARCMASQR